MQKDSTILVFGGAGFIGTSLVLELLNRGYTSIWVGDIKPIDIKPIENSDRVTYVPCDIMDEQSIQTLFAKSQPKAVYNLAGFANLDTAIRYPKRTMELNVISNLNILDASLKFGTELFIYASSAYAMSEKGSFYGISKLTSEKLVEEYAKQFGIDYAILRYGSIYAAADFENNYLFNLVKTALRDGKIVHEGDGEEVREYVHVKDVSELSVKVMENPKLWNSALMLTGNERMKRRELFEMIKEIIGNSELEINLLDGGYTDHYRFTPYSFRGTSAKKITANPHFDLGQGILDCVHKALEVIDKEEDDG